MLKRNKFNIHVLGVLGLLILYIWIIYAGKDINFDLLNYHIYSLDNFIKNRYQQDFMAGSIQSYLTPYLYLPIYLSIKWKINDYVFAVFLAILHYANIVALWQISSLIFKDKLDLYKNVLFVIFGALCPMFLITAGTSFSDPVTSSFILFSLYFLLKDDVNNKEFVFSAMAVGFAIACKFTNAFYLPSLWPIIFMRRGLMGCIKFSLITTTIFIIAYCPVGYQLYTNYGNPFFPFFNDLFQSNLFLKEAIHDKRFLGSGFLGAFILPFEMLKSQSWIYAEVPAPFLFPFLVLLFSIVNFILKKTRNGKEMEILVFFVISFLMWAVSSRIGRYALPTLMISGSLLIVLMANFFRKKESLILVSIIAALIQIFIYSSIGENRWTTVPWSNGPWITLKTSKEIKDEKSLILTTNAQTLSIISTEVNKESSIINLIGQVPLSPESEKFKFFIENNDIVYGALIRQAKGSGGANTSFAPTDDELERLKNIFAPYGLAPANEKCASTKIEEINTILLYCKLSKISPSMTTAALENKRKYDDIFNRIEKSCPFIFSPKGGETSASQRVYSRNYINTSNYLIVENGHLISYNHRSLITNVIGEVEEMRGESFWNDLRCPQQVKRRYLD